MDKRLSITRKNGDKNYEYLNYKFWKYSMKTMTMSIRKTIKILKY